MTPATRVLLYLSKRSSPLEPLDPRSKNALSRRLLTSAVAPGAGTPSAGWVRGPASLQEQFRQRSQRVSVTLLMATSHCTPGM